MKFRKKPVEIEAIQWTGDNTQAVIDFATRNPGTDVELKMVKPNAFHPLETLSVQTLEGYIQASKGDWIIKGIQGEFYPCKPDIFASTYSASGGETGATFGEAIAALKDGKRAAREGWNGKGMFIFMQVPSEIPADVIPRMTSLPDPVKAALIERGEPLKYSNQFALVKPDNSINGWTPSPADSLAEDWTVLD